MSRTRSNNNAHRIVHGRAKDGNASVPWLGIPPAGYAYGDIAASSESRGVAI
jgi:hypothetical protein